MNFLSKIGNFIKTEIIGVNEKKETPITDNNAKNILIFDTKTKKHTDSLDIESNNTNISNSKTTNKMSYKAMTETLENIPTKHFNIRKMIREGAFEKVSGILKNEFDKLSPEEQKQLITAYKYSVLKFDKLKENGEINSEAKPEELISTFGKILYESLKSGDFENTKDFEENAGNIIEDLGKDFDNKTVKEKQNILKKERFKENKRLQKKLAEIENLPEKKREILRARIIRRHRARALARHIDITALKDSKTAMQSIVLLNSKDITFGAKTVLESRANDEIRTETADYIDFNKTKELIANFKEFNDEIGEKDLTNYTQTFMSFKSEEGVKQYQAEYLENRNKYETALAKQNRGETLTQEEQDLLSTMSSRDYTASTIGIGKGALDNINMTNSQKAEFYTKWSENAKNYCDYKDVTIQVDNLIKNNVNYKNIKEEIENKENINNSYKNEKIIQDIKTQEFTNIDNTIIYENKPNSHRNVTIPKELNKTATNLKNSEQTETINKEQTDSREIAKEIKTTGNVEKAINKYGHKAIRVILDDTNLKYLRTKLKPILKGYNIEELKKVTNKCSDNSFIFICHIVKKDYIPMLKEEREHSKSLSYTAKEVIEEIERTNNNV